jgi:hypothetical protein
MPCVIANDIESEESKHINASTHHLNTANKVDLCDLLKHYDGQLTTHHDSYE